MGKDELLAIGRDLELDVTTRMAVDDLRDTVAKSKRATLSAIVRESLSRETLKEICVAAGLDNAGKEKAALVERILAAADGSNGANANYKIDPASARGSKAAERSARIGALLDGLDEVPGKRPTKAKGAQKRRRAGITDAEAVVAGTLKAALRQFVLGAAGGYTGRDAHLAFTTHLLECFGWQDGRPPGAEIPRLFVIPEGGQRVEREVSLWWPERRAMMQVVAHDAVLDFAWKDLVRVCIQIDPVPQYVVLTNQRDLHLYDLARDREAPRLAIRVDDLPKYSEAFPFFGTDWQPGATPKIVNVEKVSGEVAELVAKLYRSVCTKHPKREKDVIRFTLQCITAMFAEDIGLLPKNYFTSLLYEGAQNNDVERRLHELFTQMNTADLPAPRVVPYFNGGLFTDVTELSLGSAQVIALTKAAEANWTFVDPHIFGSVFQGIMDDEERHATGAHYTAHDDIMRVVGPTIVDPWRKRIQAATSLRELTELRRDLFAYRVLDPACGSGNFLYVAFRELYRLDTELLSRMREFPSTHGKLSWNGSISAANFYGLDINPFAVELAKVTLNIAKKIAYEERKAQAFALAGQVEMDIDPSLPLDNLDKNIVCADALFTDWPEVDAIVGNPPMLGDRKIRSELGPSYLSRLQAASGVEGVVDLSCYWFRRSHDRLSVGGRAGLVGTTGIRVGKAREAALDYIVERGGTITNAVSSREWPQVKEASVDVSMVNWTKGPAHGPYYLIVDDVAVPMDRVPTHLQMKTDLGEAKVLQANRSGTAMGVIFGSDAFVLNNQDALFEKLKGKPYFRPVATGTHMLTGVMAREPDYCILLTAYETEAKAEAAGGAAFKHLRQAVYPMIKERATTDEQTHHYERWLKAWWQPREPSTRFFTQLGSMRRVIACSNPQARPIFAFISTAFVPTNTMQIFAYDDDYSFGVIQSLLHWQWTKGGGGNVRQDIRYTSKVWKTFPWPQDPTEDAVVSVAAAGRELREVRRRLMEENSWTLRALYQSADVEAQHPLKDAQTRLDVAVRAAYGVPPDLDPTGFLLELNGLIAEDEQNGREVQGPGLPKGFDRRDARWISDDCIEPPSANN